MYDITLCIICKLTHYFTKVYKKLKKTLLDIGILEDQRIPCHPHLLGREGLVLSQYQTESHPEHAKSSNLDHQKHIFKERQHKS